MAGYGGGKLLALVIRARKGLAGKCYVITYYLQ
jgi:hypothetical protein